VETLIGEGTGYIRLVHFDQDTDRYFSDALRDLAGKGMR
jgi:hypothetical protein